MRKFTVFAVCGNRLHSMELDNGVDAVHFYDVFRGHYGNARLWDNQLQVFYPQIGVERAIAFLNQ